MRVFRLALVAVFLLVAPGGAFALTVGFNANVHNGTGQNAYDFHVEGIIMSTGAAPTVADSFVAPVGDNPGFNWGYKGGTFTLSGVDTYQYSGTWYGTHLIATCETIHIGAYFDATCHNVLLNLSGWWTDTAGTRISDPELVSDVPLLGFNVADNGTPQTLTIQNATQELIRLKNYQVAVTPNLVSLNHLVEGDPTYDALPWVTLVSGPVDVGPGGGMMAFTLGAHGVYIPPGSFLAMRGYVQDWAAPADYIFFADMHGSHVPEPAALGLAGVALLALRKRRS